MIEYWTAQPRHASPNGQLRSVSSSQRQVIVVANREPFSHEYTDDGAVVVMRAHSGVVHAVEPLIAARSGVWIAQGTGAADRCAVDTRDGIDVPIGRPAYRLRRIWLTDEEREGFYEGFSNEGLWPLCHRAYVKPIFRARDYHAYRLVNHRFADAVAAESAAPDPVVFVQDYHFALAPQLIRQRVRGSTIATFWHIPWPSWRDLEICPWRRELLEGLLGSDLVAFQTASDCDEFVLSVERILGMRVDHRERLVTCGKRRVMVRHYPASIAWPSPWESTSKSSESCKADILRSLRLRPDVRLGIGVDRLDYTKGLEEKFAAIENLLERFGEFRQLFAFVQLAQPTRGRLPAYRDVRSRVHAAVRRINIRFGADDHRPITLLEGDHQSEDVYRYLRAADVCFVSSLQDGMNLVSKEFVSAHDNERGVLVLSTFAGAARELEHALHVNPWDIEDTANVLAQALRMQPREQRHRMRRMRNTVSRRNAQRWAERILADVLAHAAIDSTASASHMLSIRSRRHLSVIDFAGGRV
jgi:trehalose 6-phosphate synthase